MSQTIRWFDCPILNTEAEVDAFFERAGTFVDNPPDQAALMSFDLPSDMDSYQALKSFAGAEGAIAEIVTRVLPDLSAAGPVHAVVFPDGRIVLTAHPDDRARGDDLRVALLSSDGSAPAAQVQGLAHLLLGLCRLNDSARKTPPLRTSNGWDDRLAAMLDPAAIRKSFAKARSAARTASARPPQSIVNDHLRWIARTMPLTGAPQRAMARPLAARAPVVQVDPRAHVVNMRHGRLSASGLVASSRGDLRAMADAARAFVDAEPQRKVVVYAHGGLVSERRAGIRSRDRPLVDREQRLPDLRHLGN